MGFLCLKFLLHLLWQIWSTLSLKKIKIHTMYVLWKGLGFNLLHYNNFNGFWNDFSSRSAQNSDFFFTVIAFFIGESWLLYNIMANCSTRHLQYFSTRFRKTRDTSLIFSYISTRKIDLRWKKCKLNFFKSKLQSRT